MSKRVIQLKRGRDEDTPNSIREAVRNDALRITGMYPGIYNEIYRLIYGHGNDADDETDRIMHKMVEKAIIRRVPAHSGLALARNLRNHICTILYVYILDVEELRREFQWRQYAKMTGAVHATTYAVELYKSDAWKNKLQVAKYHLSIIEFEIKKERGRYVREECNSPHPNLQVVLDALSARRQVYVEDKDKPEVDLKYEEFIAELTECPLSYVKNGKYTVYGLISTLSYYRELADTFLSFCVKAGPLYQKMSGQKTGKKLALDQHMSLATDEMFILTAVTSVSGDDAERRRHFNCTIDGCYLPKFAYNVETASNTTVCCNLVPVIRRFISWSRILWPYDTEGDASNLLTTLENGCGATIEETSNTIVSKSSVIGALREIDNETTVNSDTTALMNNILRSGYLFAEDVSTEQDFVMRLTGKNLSASLPPKSSGTADNYPLLSPSDSLATLGLRVQD